MKDLTYPTWEWKTQRKWKQAKRRELRKVLAVFDELRMGSAYFGRDAYMDILGLEKHLKGLTEKLSLKNWGR